jgi:hypothetical protein
MFLIFVHDAKIIKFPKVKQKKQVFIWEGIDVRCSAWCDGGCSFLLRHDFNIFISIVISF